MSKNQSKRSNTKLYPIGMTRRCINIFLKILKFIENYWLLISLILITVFSITLWIIIPHTEALTSIILLTSMLIMSLLCYSNLMLIILIAPLLMLTSIVDLFLFTRYLWKPQNRIVLLMLIPTALTGFLIWVNHASMALMHS